MHPFLQKQNLDYQIFVVEQAGDKNKLFNKGKQIQEVLDKGNSVRLHAPLFSYLKKHGKVGGQFFAGKLPKKIQLF